VKLSEDSEDYGEEEAQVANGDDDEAEEEMNDLFA
jgi:U3 small nucleolar RNA-associated protein MPP10